MSQDFGSWSIHHAAIRVPDFARALSWFIDVLEWELGAQWTAGPLSLAYVSPRGDSSTRLEIIGGGGIAVAPMPMDLPSTLGTAGWHHIGISVDSVDGAVAGLEGRGVQFIDPPTGVPDRAYFLDPFGNIYELRPE